MAGQWRALQCGVFTRHLGQGDSVPSFYMVQWQYQAFYPSALHILILQQDTAMNNTIILAGTAMRKMAVTVTSNSATSVTCMGEHRTQVLVLQSI